MIVAFLASLEKIFSQFYSNHIPQSMKTFLYPFKFFIKFRILPRIQHLSLSIYLLEGTGKQCEEKLSVLVFGDKVTLLYISDILFSKKPKIEFIGKIPIWRISKNLRCFSHKADMIFVKTDVFFSKYMQRKGFIIIPEWGDTWLDISNSFENIYKKFKKSAKEDIQKIKQYEYTYEISTDYDKLSLFYHKLYAPFISARHGQLALPESMNLNYEDIKSIFKRGKLLLVKEKGRYVAGLIIITYGKKAFPIYMGVEANSDHLLKGGGSALYYFCIRWAKENGFKLLRFGDVRPFLNDGLFRYKQKWGMTIDISKTRFGIFAFKIFNFNTKSVINFLENNPFIYLDKKQLKGFVFIRNPVIAEEIQSVYKKYFTPGLKQLSIVSTTESLEKSIKTLDCGVTNETISIPLDTTPNYSKMLSGVLKIETKVNDQSINISHSSIKDINYDHVERPKRNLRYLIEEYNLNPEQAKQILSEGHQKNFERLAKKYPSYKNIIVRTFLSTFPKFEKENIDIQKIDFEMLDAVFSTLSKEKYSKESVPLVLKYLVQHNTHSIEEAIKACDLNKISQEELEKIIEKIVNDRKEFIQQHGLASLNPLMGVVIKELHGKADGKIISKILKEKIEGILNF